MSVPTAILSAVRTPWGRLLGSLSDVSGPELGALAARQAITASGIVPEDLELALFGNVLAGATGGNPSGATCRAAGLTPKMTALTLRSGCASGLAAVAQAADAVAAGRVSVVLAGGFESSSRAPHLADGLRRGLRLGSTKLRDSARHDGPVAHDPAPDEDRQRFASAVREGRPAEEIFPVDLPRPRKGASPRVETDDPPAGTATLPHLADGAAALVLASAEWAEARGLRPLCLVESLARPLAALSECRLVLADLAREGWASLDAALAGSKGPEVNPDGAGGALGHAAGADGARLVVSLVHAIRRGEAGPGMALAGDPYGGLTGLAARP